MEVPMRIGNDGWVNASMFGEKGVLSLVGFHPSTSCEANSASPKRTPSQALIAIRLSQYTDAANMALIICLSLHSIDTQLHFAQGPKRRHATHCRALSS